LPRELSLDIARESKRLLREGGKLIITTPNYKSAWPAREWVLNKTAKVSYEEQHICQYSVSTLGELLRQAGFSKVDVTTYMLFSPFAAALTWRFSDSLWSLDRIVSAILGRKEIADPMSGYLMVDRVLFLANVQGLCGKDLNYYWICCRQPRIAFGRLKFPTVLEPG
jgi:hypothetical protein